MRYVTVVLTPTEEYVSQQVEGEYVDPREIRIDGTLVATQEAIHYVNLLDDGTAVGVAQFRGDADRLETIEDESPEILSCTVTSGETWLAYLHYEPNELETTLFELVDTEAISIDWPMREIENGLRATFFGEEESLRRVIANIPDELNVALERVGDYQPEMEAPAERLTDRQREIVRTAIAMGYYDIPRRATQRDLAAEFGLSRGTIGEHLRRIEAKIIRSAVY